jgi:hypothetical protein
VSVANFLTGQDAGFEGGLGNWTQATNSSIAVSSAQAHTGTQSLAMTATAAGSMDAANCTAAAILTKGSPVVPGQPVRVAGWFRAATAAKSCNMGIDWYGPTGTLISGSHGANITDSTSAWTQAVNGYAAPAGAAFCRARPQVVSAASGGVHYLDDVEINPLLTYDLVLSRVRIDLAVVRAAAGVDGTGVVQRSTDQIQWSTVRGGGAAPVTAAAVPLDDYEFAPDVTNYYRVLDSGTYLGDVLPTLGGLTWLKSIRYPFLSMPVTLADATDITRPASSGTFAVIGRSLPVAVTSVRQSAQLSVMVRTETPTDRIGLTALLATGDVVMLQTPALTPDGFSYPVPSGYYLVADSVESREGMPWDRRTFTLPVTEVDAPDPSITPVTITWQGIVDSFPSWTALAAGVATWAATVQQVGAPADVIVP